jgi:hypothetical protein
MNEVDFPLHKPGRTSLIITSVLLMILCMTFPVAIYMLVRMGSLRVRVGARGLEAKGWFMTDEVNWDDVERFGVLRVPVVARGLGAVIARMKLNNMNEGVNLVFRLKNGKDVKFIANQYENHEAMIERVAASVRVPKEEIKMGLLSWKWPEKA